MRPDDHPDGNEPGTVKGGGMDAKWSKAFEESWKRNEEAMRRLAKL